MTVDDLADDIEAAVPSTSQPCPVTPLGRRNGVFYYLSAAGEVLPLSARSHDRNGILALFDGNSEWLAQACPVRDNNGHIVQGAWNTKTATQLLMRMCANAGYFDDRISLRGLGVWPTADGEIVVNVGNALWIDGSWETVGQCCDGAIYIAGPARERPASEVASYEAGRDLLEFLRLWTFESSVGAEIILGFIGVAMLGGAPTWRTHCLVVGQFGSGKSELTALVGAALGGLATFGNNVTEAGLRQALKDEAGVILLDEAESDGRSSTRIQQVIRLIRLMSSGAGAKVMRGSAAGQAQSFSVTGCAWLAAISPPTLKPQDRSRISVVRLRKLPVGPEAVGGRERVQEAIRAAADMSPRLRARAIAHWHRFQETFTIYRNAFLKRGCDPRDSDRIATLLAGRDLLTMDVLPVADFVEAEVLRFEELMVEAREQDEEGEGQQCLNRLLSSGAELDHSGDRETVSQVIIRALRDAENHTRQQLGIIGLKIEHWADRESRALLVANQHSGLDRIFRDSPWSEGRWVQALRYLPGAAPSEKPMRFAGVLSRATRIPAKWLPREDHDAEDCRY